MFILLCGLVVHFCVVVCLQKSDNTVIVHQPLGYQMCSELCSTFDGCYFPKYDPVPLRCNIEITTVKNRSCGDVYPITKTCTIRTRYSRTIHTRRKGLRKVTRTWKVPGYKKTGTKDPACPAKLNGVDLNVTLHQACKDGKQCVVQFILFQHPDEINTRDKHGRTPVMAAVRKGQVAVYRYLIGHNCDLTAIDNHANTVLHSACVGGNTDIVSDLVINQKCNVEVKERHGWTPVMVSVFFGFVDVFEFLLSKGCNVTIVDELMNNILHVACMGGHADILQYILSKEMYDLESKGEVGRTAVMIAAYYGRNKVVQLLISYGCKLSAVDDNNDNILHVACLGGHVSMVKYILTLNTNGIESRGFCGETPVIRAAGSAQIAVLEFLVKKGCNLTAVNNDTNNILHVACAGGYVDMVKHILLHYGFDIESTGQYERTPVMFAAYSGSTETFEFLVAKGCDILTQDSRQNNILHMACIGGNADMVKHILSQYKTHYDVDSTGQYGRTPVICAAYYGKLEVFDVLVAKGCDVEKRNYLVNNILHAAVCGGHVDMVKHIVSNKLININSRGQYKRTAVMKAVITGHVELVKYLVVKGSVLTVVDSLHNNILHLACSFGHIVLVKYILSLHIVGIDSRGHDRKTPLMFAAIRGDIGIMKFLVLKGCKFTLTDLNGNNVLHHACLQGHVNVVKYIVKILKMNVESRGQFGQLKLAKNKDRETPSTIADLRGYAGLVSLLKGSM